MPNIITCFNSSLVSSAPYSNFILFFGSIKKILSIKTLKSLMACNIHYTYSTILQCAITSGRRERERESKRKKQSSFYFNIKPEIKEVK